MNWRHVLIFCAFVGVIVSLLSLQNHFSSDASFCTVSETFDCDVVNRGPYSEIFGVPVALLGVLGYLFFALLLLKEGFISESLSFSSAEFLQYTAYLATFMLVFSLYLTALEVFVIHAYCILCLISQAMTIILCVGSWLRVSKQ